MDEVDESPGSRGCGTCSFCCRVLELRGPAGSTGISEISKPSGLRCSHCTPGRGCGIYGARPSECRTFRCGWLEGFGDEQDRPDLLHAVLMGATPFRQIPGATAMQWVLDEGAWARPSRRLIGIRDVLVRDGHVVLWAHVNRRHRKLFVPKGVVGRHEALRLYIAETDCELYELGLGVHG